LATAGRDGGVWAAALKTDERLAARKNAAATNAQCEKAYFHKNLPGTIASAASSIRPRVYYDDVADR
jgi:hypothetical protein